MSDGQSQAAACISTNDIPLNHPRHPANTKPVQLVAEGGPPSDEDLAVEAGIIASQMCGDMEGKRKTARRIIDLAKWYSAGKFARRTASVSRHDPPAAFHVNNKAHDQ